MKKRMCMIIVCVGSMFGHPWGDVELTRPEKVLALYQVMKDVHELLEKHGIRYWVDAGTLLGAVRHKGIIPWDYDIDIGVDKKDEQALLGLESELVQLGYGFTKEFYWGFHIGNDRVHLDVFFYTKEGDRYMYADVPTRTQFAKRDDGPLYITQDELFPLKKYTFGAFEVWGPQRPHVYLDTLYPDWSTTARFLETHWKYSSVALELSDKYCYPGQPLGPLEDKVV